MWFNLNGSCCKEDARIWVSEEMGKKLVQPKRRNTSTVSSWVRRDCELSPALKCFLAQIVVLWNSTGGNFSHIPLQQIQEYFQELEHQVKKKNLPIFSTLYNIFNEKKMLLPQYQIRLSAPSDSFNLKITLRLFGNPIYHIS